MAKPRCQFGQTEPLNNGFHEIIEGIEVSISPEALEHSKAYGLDLEAELRKAVEIQAEIERELQAAKEAEEEQGEDFSEEDEVAIEDTNVIEVTDDRLLEFLDRAAFRQDKAAGIAAADAEPKRPVGRPRKDGSPAGSPRPRVKKKKAAKK